MEAPIEDGNANALFVYPRFFTITTGCGLECSNIKTKKQYEMKRSASIPAKATACNDKLLVLNKDGSLTWYSPEIPLPLSDWFVTKDGELVTF